MGIKTKFTFGDKVWTIKGCKAVEFEVSSISINLPKTLLPIIYITYCGACKDGNITTATEPECFASKEELIGYIFDDGNENM